jgi:hypothetical protein
MSQQSPMLDLLASLHPRIGQHGPSRLDVGRESACMALDSRRRARVRAVSRTISLDVIDSDN